MTAQLDAIDVLVDRIRPILRGHPPEVQGAALADLVAMWLAGFHVPGDEDATRTMRAGLLANHCFAVRQIVPLYAKSIGTTP